MGERFQFSLKNVLVATALVAVWCALFAAHSVFVRDVAAPLSWPLAYSYFSFMVWLPAVAVGALFGRLALAATCGAASVLAMFAITHFLQ